MKDTFFKSAIILLIGGAITKALGMLIKIIMTRVVGLNGISMYMLIFPTFSLFMTLSQFSFPISISKLIAEEKYNSKKLIISIIPLTIIINIILMIIIIISAPFISNNLLKNKDLYYPILTIALVLPFDSISSILRGYFFGKQKMIPHISSLIIEQIVRLTLIILIIPTLLKINIIYAVMGLIAVNIFSELSSIIFLSFFIPNKKINSKDELKPNKADIKRILRIAVPTTSSRLIGSICYFIEPIIITYTLSKTYTISYITQEYGLIEGYVLPLLMIPNFFTSSISSALLPTISNYYSNKKYKEIKTKIKQVITISLLIGIPTTIILILKPNILLKLIYNVDKGENYIKVLAPFFILLYIQGPLSSVLQAINESKAIMYHNLIGTLLKITAIVILSKLNIGLYNFIIAMIINVTTVTILHIIEIKKKLK